MHGGGAYKSSNHVTKRKAFTLAEVLITLAIIGVVAALTIPTVVAKYQKHQYYTQFMKVYNTLSNALTIAVNENGNPNTWGFDYGNNNSEELIEKNVIPYLKVAKKITESDDECDYSVTLLSGEKEREDYGEMIKYSSGWEPGETYLLDDGSIVEIILFDGYIRVGFDTNGLKGPNTVGRDVFWETLTYGSDHILSNSVLDNFDSREEIDNALLNDDEFNCNPEMEESYGYGCSAKLLLDGKMDY